MSDSIHVRRLRNRVERSTARLLAHAERHRLDVADLSRVRLPWFRVRADAADAGQGEAATVFIFDEIGGSFGVDAGELVQQIEAVAASTITVRINSPGGVVVDAIAIHSALLHHPAKVRTYVDGIAASAASIIAMAADPLDRGTDTGGVFMMPGSQMMIHDASCLEDGDERDHKQIATFLGRQSGNIADLYRQKGGGTAAQWRDLMIAETWLFAAEAVEFRLADQAIELARPSEDPDIDELMTRSHEAALGQYRYAGRHNAPTPNRWRGTNVQPRSHARRGDHATGLLRQLGELIGEEDDRG